MKTKANTINLETDKIVVVKIIDHDWDDSASCPSGILDTYYLINPDPEKLKQLKEMVETRFDYADNATDEEIEAKEFLCDHIWESIEEFIAENFVSLDIAEVFEISY